MGSFYITTVLVQPIRKPTISHLQIVWEYMRFGNFTDTKGISQEFSDCGLHMTNIQKISPSKIVDFVPAPTLHKPILSVIYFIWKSIILRIFWPIYRFEKLVYFKFLIWKTTERWMIGWRVAQQAKTLILVTVMKSRVLRQKKGKESEARNLS